MSQMAKQYPDVVAIVDYGKSYENRTISLMRVNQILVLKNLFGRKGWDLLIFRGI